MFKKILFICAILTIPFKAECSNRILDLDKAIAEKKSSRQIPIPDSMYDFLPEGIRDVEMINDTNQPFELAVIALKYIHRTVEQLILKEKFAPEESWCIEENEKIITPASKQLSLCCVSDLRFLEV